MKRAIIAVIVIIILVAGGFAVFHKSSSNDTSTKSSTTNSNSTNNNAHTAPAVNNAVLITKTDSKVGQYLADPSGKALYIYGGDSSGVSNCTGSCLANWPAYIDVGATTGLPAGVATIKRSDNGQVQFTYNGKPLYYFTNDSNGQVTGDGVKNFKVAKPAAASSSSSSSTTTQSSSGTSSGSPY